MSVWAWGSNKSCPLGIGTAVRTAFPAPCGYPASPALEETTRRPGNRRRGSAATAAVGAAARLFEGEIQREAEQAALDDERLRPDARAAAAAAPAAADWGASPANELSSRVVVTVACGEQHTVCSDDLGFVWSWGRSREGQLGHGGRPTNVPCPYPKRVEPLSSVRVRRVAAGAYSSLVLTAQAQLYAFGLRYVEQSEVKHKFFGVGDWSRLSEAHQRMISESHFQYLDGPAEGEPEPEPEEEDVVADDAEEEEEEDGDVLSRGGALGMASTFEGGGAGAAQASLPSPTPGSKQKRSSFERRSVFTPYLMGEGAWGDGCEVVDVAGGCEC